MQWASKSAKIILFNAFNALEPQGGSYTLGVTPLLRGGGGPAAGQVVQPLKDPGYHAMISYRQRGLFNGL